MDARGRWDERVARGLRSVERIPGGALLYNVFFGHRKPPEPGQVSFADIDASERRDDPRTTWALVIGAHLLLILVPVVALMPAPEADTEPERGMMVELVSEPQSASGKGARESEAKAAPIEEAADIGPVAGLPVLAGESGARKEAIAVGDASTNAPTAPEPAVTAAAPQAREAPAPQGLAAGGPGTMPAEEARWEGAIIERLERRKRYPKAMLKAGVEDRVMLRLVINREGKLVRAEVARSGGHAELNAEVLALARRASPYPRPPGSVAGETVSMLVPVEFLVKKAR